MNLELKLVKNLHANLLISLEIPYNGTVEQLKSKSLSGFSASLVVVGFSFIVVAAFSILSKQIASCNNDACRTPQNLVGNVTSIVGKKLNLNRELITIADGKGMAILLSTGCSACKKVDYAHLAALAKSEKLALVWVTSIDPSPPPRALDS